MNWSVKFTAQLMIYLLFCTILRVTFDSIPDDVLSCKALHYKARGRDTQE